MIKSKRDLKYYLNCDRLSLGIDRKKPKIGFNRDLIWRFEILMRKCEYYKNCPSFLHKILFQLYRLKFHNLSIKLGLSIPINVFGPGLSIAHYGTIIVNSNAKVGKNCRLHAGSMIVATNGESDAPTLGDNVYVGSGSKIIGKISIGNNVCIAAGAVVTKSFPDNITIGGVPAKIISKNNSLRMLKKLLTESDEFKSEFKN